MAAYLAAAIVAFRSEALWLPIAAPAVQLLFAAALSLRLKQLTERAELGIGTSEEAALALTKRGKAEKVDRRVILFADERGSKKRLRRELESLDVAERRALQSDFAIARDVPIAEHGGNINHTLADSMLAYWITPDTCDSGGVAQKVNAACRAALAIHDRVAALNQKYPGFELALRVGLDWGDVSSRLNPSPQIKDWKMEGAPIHVAERLESLNKVFGTSTLVSHAVASVLESKQFQTLELGTFVFCDDSGDVVAGPVQVHELRSAAAATSATGALAARFENALAALYRGDWAAALVRFEELASSDRGHGELASSYAGWCRQTLKETDSRWCGLVMVTFSDKSQYLDRFIGGEAVAPLR